MSFYDMIPRVGHVADPGNVFIGGSRLYWRILVLESRSLVTRVDDSFVFNQKIIYICLILKLEGYGYS